MPFICCACLNKNVKMYSLDENHTEFFRCLTGLQLSKKNSLICFICIALLNRCQKFRDNALKASENLEKSAKLTQARTHIEILNTSEIIHLDISSEKSLHNNIKYEIHELIKKEDLFDLSSNYKDLKNENRIEVTVDYENSCKEEINDTPHGNVESDDDIPLNLFDKIKKKTVKKKKKTKVKCERKSENNEHKTKSPNLLFDILEFATLKTMSVEEQLEEIAQRKSSSNYINSPFKCDHCFKGFINKDAFDNHTKLHMRVSGDHVCPICKLRTKSENLLRKHTVSTHERKYECKQCSHISNTISKAKEHILWHKGIQYRCEICGAVFSKKTTKLSHVRLTHPSSHICSECGASFVGELGLSMHIKRTHLKAEKRETDIKNSEIFCKDCNIQFTSEKAWNMHMISAAKHIDQIDFSNGCRRCGENFSSRRELLEHRKTRHKIFKSVARRYTQNCRLCPAKFFTSQVLNNHYQRDHKEAAQKYVKVFAAIICEWCGKKFQSKAHLINHQRAHRGEKPCKCSECDRCFADKYQLRLHTRIHTGERPYPCGSCPKAFHSKAGLNRHVKIHTGERPYTCQYCGKAFTQSNSVKLHVMTVHLKLPDPYKRSKAKKKSNESEKRDGF